MSRIFLLSVLALFPFGVEARAVRMIVPFAPGERLGQQLVGEAFGRVMCAEAGWRDLAAGTGVKDV